MDQSLIPVVTVAGLAEQPVIGDWLLLGPFVVETGASFEREYLFERHKILEIDYLATAGGEAAARPVQDQAVPNPYLGAPRLQWQRERGSRLGFTWRTGDLLYRTVQRNAVWYAASYVDSDREQTAFVEAYHSGMRLFLNGELIWDQPYGGAKGLGTRQMLLPVQLKAGRNLFLAKVRPGYIADGVEYCLINFTVRPALVESGGVVATAPAAREVFLGPAAAPRQVLEVRCANLGANPVTAAVAVGEECAEAELAAGASALLRLGAPAGKVPGQPAAGELALEVGGRREAAKFTYLPAAAPDPRGVGLVYTDFHFDTTYHEEQRVYAMGAFDIVRRYCEQLRRDPFFKCTLSELDYLKPYFDMFPADRALLRQAHREGRAESDVFYNQPQAMNCCGETFVRNMLYGQLWHEEVLGRRCYIYSPGDVFGHPAQMSQIAAKGGCTGVGWDKHIFGFPPLFRHISPDGTHLVHRRGHVDRASALAQGVTAFLTGTDKTAPTAWQHELVPPVWMAVPSEFHERVEQDCREGKAKIPLTSRDMSLYHAGTALSRIELKIGNRIAENLLISAEKFAAFAGLLGARYPEQPLDKGWRQLLCGQHHDSITGTHNEISYVDLMVGYREAAELGWGVLADALGYISRAARAQAAAHERALRLFNPHCWDRTDLCRAKLTLPEGWEQLGLRDSRGQAVACQVLSRQGQQVELAFVATVPSLGYTTYYLTNRPELPAGNTERQEVTQVENASFRLAADPARGGLVSMYDRREGRELLDTGSGLVGAELSVLREVPERHETQHELYTTGQALHGRNCPAQVHALVGEVVQTLVIEQKLSDTMPRSRQELSLMAGVDRVDCRVLLEDYQFEDDLFVLTFPTNLRGAVPTFDDRYCAVARRESKGLLDFRTHQMFMFSGCAVYAADRWLEYGPTVTLDLGEAGRCSLGMTALISPEDGSLSAAGETLMMALTHKGIPVTPWPDAEQEPIGTMLPGVNDDLQYQDFRLVLTTAGAPNRFAQGLIAKAGAAGARFREQMAAGPAALFLVDDENGEGKPIRTLVLGAPDAGALEGVAQEIAQQLRAGETVSLQAEAGGSAGGVDEYGITLVNTGNIACSVERGGVLALLLFHTCRWYGATGNIPGGSYVPEQRTHAYTYSLAPHRGSWRQAQAYRRAMEVNDPLLVVPVEGSGEVLPETASLLSTDAPGVTVTALKALGNPLAGMQGKVAELPERGLALRFYEADGRPAQGSFRFLPELERAVTASMLERPEQEAAVSGHGLPFACGPYSIETYGVITKALAQGPAAELGAQAEPAQPVFVRSWEHDAGTMPMGYEAVVASLGRDAEDLADGKLRVNVNVVNDYVDVPASGQVRLLLPEGWQAEQTVFDYHLEPLGHATFPVVVTRPSPQAQGQVKIRYQHGGQELQDVLEVGRAVEPTFTLRLEPDAILAAVENPGTESLECELAIASPVETWPAAVVGPLSLAEITPRTIGLSLAPGERREVRFPVSLTDEPVMSAWWAVGKLMANGRIYLRRVTRRGEEPNWSAGSWWEAIRAGKQPRAS